LRLSKIERAALERRASGAGLSTYVKSVLFGETQAKARGRRVSADQVLLAQILGQLGASGLASSLGRLVAAADSGSLHLDDLTIGRLHDACDDVRGIHLHLMKALGKKLPKTAAHQNRLTVQFIRAAADIEAQP
jgi:hypothetical protein